MFVATVIVSAVLAFALLGSGFGKVTGNAAVVASVSGVGVPPRRIPLLAIPEAAGALGLIGGLFWWPIGVAAAIGVILYFLLAVGAHLRVRDVKNVGPAGFLLVLAVVALVLRLATV
jgi:hypothetical protein